MKDELKPMLRVGATIPPQFLNESGEWEIVRGSAGAYNSQTVQTVSADYFEGTGNLTKVFDEDMNGLSIFNDGTAPLRFTVNGASRPVFPKGSYSQIFKRAFRSITISATGPWYADALQQLGATTTAVVPEPPEPPDTAAPDNVTNLELSNVTQNGATLTWTASVSTDTVGYEIWRGGSLITTVTVLTYTATGLTAETQYTYTIKAKDAAGNVATGTSVIVTTSAQPADTTPPANVTNLTSSNVTQTSATLTWSASVSFDIKDYRVYNGASLIATVTATTYGVTGLTAGTTNTFTVKSRDTSDNESAGVSVNVTTTAAADITPPEPITNLTAGTPTATTIPITWTASVSSDVVTQEVAYSTDGANFTVASAVISASTTSYTVTGLTAETAYTVRVVAVDGAGNRSTAVTISATTIKGQAPVSPVVDASRTLFLENVANGTTVPDPNNYFVGTTDFTLAVTAKFAVSGPNAGTMIVNRWVSAGTENVMKLEFTWQHAMTGNMYGTKADTTNWNPGVSSSPATYTDWDKFYHIVLLREGTAFKLFIDDAQIHSTTIAATDIVRQTSSLPLIIGQSGKAATFKNVSYYNRALSATERLQNYNALK